MLFRWTALAVVPLLVACAPLASMRPASAPADARAMEVGIAATAVGPRPYVDEPWNGAGQLWGTWRAAPRIVLSAIGAFDGRTPVGGGALRVDVLKYPRFRGGVEVELGWAWGALSLPVALRIVDETWVYAGPRASNWGDDLLLGFPFGLSVGVFERFSLRAEVQVSWADLDPYRRRVHAALGAAVQF